MNFSQFGPQIGYGFALLRSIRVLETNHQNQYLSKYIFYFIFMRQRLTKIGSEVNVEKQNSAHVSRIIDGAVEVGGRGTAKVNRSIDCGSELR